VEFNQYSGIVLTMLAVNCFDQKDEKCAIGVEVQTWQIND
jgi:hypothetical protein